VFCRMFNGISGGGVEMSVESNITKGKLV